MPAITNNIRRNPTTRKNIDPPLIRRAYPVPRGPVWGALSNSDQFFDKGVQRLTKAKWIETINGQLSALGVQEPAYIPAIETLAGILEQRDKTFKEFKASGGKSVIEYTNKGGSTNMTKNPLLVLWDDLNKSALAYWREMGLTPSSYKKVTGDAPKKEKPQGLVEVLSKLETG